jgi:hypothetical protein
LLPRKFRPTKTLVISTAYAASHLPFQVGKTGVGDVAVSLAWTKGLAVRRIWPAVNAPPLALDYRPRPLLRPAMPRGEFDELLEVGTLALARPEEPDRSRYAQVQHRDLLDRRYLEMGGNK